MTTSNIHVRVANMNDLDFLVSFTLAEANEAEGSEKSSVTVSNGIRVSLENSAIAQYWVLENNEKKLIGSVSVVKEWSDWHAGYYWWIQSMFIQPEYRGQGLMNLLLNEVKEAAKTGDALELRLYVHKDNIRAIRAYNREGFLDSPYQIMTMNIREV
jgi:GNAT superfamily N-acetyltransferase